jgi:hypothetical protein
MEFYRLAIGARFKFFGRIYEKTAMSMAEDDAKVGYVFMGGLEVTLEPGSEGKLLPPEVAARWKPPEWLMKYMRPDPGETEGEAACCPISCPSDGHSQPGASPTPG